MNTLYSTDLLCCHFPSLLRNLCRPFIQNLKCAFNVGLWWFLDLSSNCKVCFRTNRIFKVDTGSKNIALSVENANIIVILCKKQSLHWTLSTITAKFQIEKRWSLIREVFRWLSWTLTAIWVLRKKMKLLKKLLFTKKTFTFTKHNLALSKVRKYV